MAIGFANKVNKVEPSQAITVTIIPNYGDSALISFRRVPRFPGFTALPICPAMLSAHGRIENRDIGDAAILDEQFSWDTQSSDVKTLWLARTTPAIRQAGNAGKVHHAAGATW
ncbi:hypothetical protein [Mesorhizobium sp. M0220]|uniref:hypothetical protein n=1 Tax=unclassified Mesorhizobium TaxID=325217 RepID=UPI00333A1828